jgi:uncharacterized membrane protein HdeD (DUF308 family)
LLVQAMRSTSQGNRLGPASLGVIAVIVAFFAIFSPGVTAQTLTWIVGVWLIVRGVFEVFTAISSYRLTPRWMLLVGAGLSILLGVFFVANPGRGAVGIAVWLGLMALCWGVVLVVAGLMLSRQHAWPPAPATTPDASSS